METNKRKGRCGRKGSDIPLSERKVIYARSQKERDQETRHEAKQIRASGNEKDRRLYFMDFVFKSKGMSLTEVAAKASLSPQSLSWIMISDDTKLQNVHMIFRSLGLTIEPEIVPHVQYAVPGPVLVTESYELVFVPEMPRLIDPVLEMSIEKNGVLAFLARFLRDNWISVERLSDDCSIHVSSLKYMFDVDNIRISKLYCIADRYGRRIRWNVSCNASGA